MSRTLLTVFAAGWCLFGVLCFAAPSAMLGGFGIELTGADAVTEIRAMYGGAQLGLALFFGYASRSEALHRPALVLVALIMGGFAIARMAGMVLDGSTGPLTVGSVAFEVVVAGAAVFALRGRGSPELESAA